MRFLTESARARGRWCLVVWLAMGARPGAADPGAAPTIVVDFVVEDAAGRPVADLKVAEVEVVQDAERQKVATFEAHPTPGRYEITYVPHSGRPAGVTVRILRGGSRVRGPEGGGLRPRVLPGRSEGEVEWDRSLESRAETSTLAFRVAVLEFDARTEGVRYTLAVEVPAAEVAFPEAADRSQGRIQILTRLKDAEGRIVQRLSFERPLESAGPARVGGAAFEQLVWTGHVRLAAGRYSAEVLVGDPVGGKAGRKDLVLEVPAATGALRLSSVVLLQPRGFLNLAESVADDPLVVNGEPVMPTLELALPAGTPAQVRFLAILYPDPRSGEPPRLRLELRRGQELVGNVPLKLPPPQAGGELRYVGLLATRNLRPATYGLRLVAEQGPGTAQTETAFTIHPAAP